MPTQPCPCPAALCRRTPTDRADKPARLQHQPSGVFFSIVEPDLQSGSAVAHVIDVLPPAAVLSKVAASPADEQDLQYR